MLRLVYSQKSHIRGEGGRGGAVFYIKVTPSCCRVREVCTVVNFFLLLLFLI